jgi:hypothetical protein
MPIDCRKRTGAQLKYNYQEAVSVFDHAEFIETGYEYLYHSVEFAAAFLLRS